MPFIEDATTDELVSELVKRFPSGIVALEVRPKRKDDLNVQAPVHLWGNALTLLGLGRLVDYTVEERISDTPSITMIDVDDEEETEGDE